MASSFLVIQVIVPHFHFSCRLSEPLAEMTPAFQASPAPLIIICYPPRARGEIVSVGHESSPRQSQSGLNPSSNTWKESNLRGQNVFGLRGLWLRAFWRCCVGSALMFAVIRENTESLTFYLHVAPNSHCRLRLVWFTGNKPI